MPVTPSSWVVCASCGEIVLQSGDPDVQGRYHAPTCPELPPPRVRVMSPRDDGVTEFTLGAGGGRGGPGEPGGIWLTGDGPDEPDEPAEPDFEEHDFGEHEPGLHRRQRMPAGDMIRAAVRRVRPAFSFSLTDPGDRNRRIAVVVLIGLSVFGLVVYLVAGLGRPAAKAAPQAAGGTPPASAAQPAPRTAASTPAPSAKPTPAPSVTATNPGGGAGGSGGGGGSSPQPAVNCTTSAALGNCGPYTDAQITGISPGTGIEIGNNVWNADQVSGWSQTLYAASPGDWGVIANMPAGNSTAVSYPTVAADYIQGNSTSAPLSNFASIYSSFAETMNANSGTIAAASYEISIGSGSGTSATADVLIENDVDNLGGCGSSTTATFGGSGGVPVRTWKLCNYGGGELAWVLTGGSEPSGSVDILSMVSWLVNNGNLPSDTGIFQISYGWEIASTGGQSENFQVSGYSIAVTQS